MDTRYDNRTRGVVLTTLDIAPMIETLTEQVRKVHAEMGTDNPDQLEAKFNWGPYAVAEGNGVLHVVNSEGIIVSLGPDDKYTFDIYVAEPGRIAMIPEYRVSLTPDEIRAMAVGEQIDLADLIRSFGSRLESNFRICYETITEVS